MSTGTLCETAETYSMLILGLEQEACKNIYIFLLCYTKPPKQAYKHAKIDGIELQNE